MKQVSDQIRTCAAGLGFQSICSITRSTNSGGIRVSKCNAFRAADYAWYLSKAFNAVAIIFKMRTLRVVCIITVKIIIVISAHIL